MSNPAAERVMAEVDAIARAMGHDPAAVRGDVLETLAVHVNVNIPSLVLTTLARIARRPRIGDQVADKNHSSVTGQITDTWYDHPPGEVVTGLVAVRWDAQPGGQPGWHNGDALRVISLRTI